MQEYNREVFQILNGFSSNEVVAIVAPLLADIPIFFLPLFLVSMWLYYRFTYSYSDGWGEGYKMGLMHIFYGCVIAIGLSLIIQQYVSIDRPETAITGASKLLLEHIPDASFPSDHASVGTAFLFGLFFFRYRKVFWAFLPWVILMCLSRVIAGVHWPLDILVGAGVGFVSAFISFSITGNKLVKTINLLIIKILSFIKL